MTEGPSIPLDFQERPLAEMQARAASHYADLLRRRSVLEFDPRPVPQSLIEYAILSAGTAPSGAHQQPWRFAVVLDPALKRQIREAAEQEAYQALLSRRMLDDLPPPSLYSKPFLETAPWLVVMLAVPYEVGVYGERTKHVFVEESCGMAAGLFLTAIHQMGLVAGIYAPGPMRFLNPLLKLPSQERPFIVFPVGYPAPGAEVPDLPRKPLEDIARWYLRTEEAPETQRGP